ncbi:SPOR domain-containing protein [Paracoccus sp. MC1854]|uniref:SPOR domain-containing protein n=1 Tax=Paracoccus sp. MC1854 TaxID=2760306 RepID=UPI001603A3A0|nr:SPOR domain-containing protein [Paracoccus sp. MC1854]
MRADPDGAPLCGFPPTLSARRTAFGNEGALFPKPDEPAAERIHREFAEAIIPNLQAGELLQVPGTQDDLATSGADLARVGADHGAAIPPRLAMADEGGTQGELGKMMARAPGLAAGMTRANHTDRLCALIGKPAHDTGAAGLGLCGSGTALSAAPPGRQVSEAKPAARRIATDERAERGTRQPGRQIVSVDSAATKARPTPSLPRASRGMIPPGARYLQVGVFSETEEANRMARKLAGLGLPVARSRDAGRGQQMILVGPLDGREAIVRIIDRLGRAGFRDVVARR